MATCKDWLSPVLLLTLGVGGCVQSGPVETAITPAAAEPAQVVATTSILCDLTQQIAQDTVSLTCLLDPGQDPHTYQPAPSDRQALEEANLVLYGGHQLAPGLERLIRASDPATAIAVYEVAVPDPLRSEGHDAALAHGEAAHGEAAHGEDQGEAVHGTAASDHGHGHDHGHEAAGPDPHVWHNAANNAAIAQVIANELAAVNPEDADRYQTQAAALAEQFTTLHTWIQAQVATVPASDRRLVTTHNAFRYFADAYGFEVAGALSGLSTAERPAASRLTAMVEQVKAAQVPAIFAETTTNRQLIETVAQDAGVSVAAQALFVAGPGGPGTAAETTQAMLVSNTCAIVNALGGACAEAEAPL